MQQIRPMSWRLLAFAALFLCASAVLAQTTAFSYQGKLTDTGNPANGNYDLEFRLFDTATPGTGVQQGATVSQGAVAVAGIWAVIFPQLRKVRTLSGRE